MLWKVPDLKQVIRREMEAEKAKAEAKQAELAELSKGTIARAGDIEKLAKDIAKQYRKWPTGR